MFDLIIMPMWPVPFPQNVVATVPEICDLILDHDLTITDCIKGLKGEVIKNNMIIEYSNSYISSLMEEMRFDSRFDSYSDQQIRDAIKDEIDFMMKGNENVLKHLIFEELIERCQQIPLNDVARMLNIKYETAHSLLEKAKKKMRNQAVYEKLKSVGFGRKGIEIEIKRTIFVETVC